MAASFSQNLVLVLLCEAFCCVCVCLKLFASTLGCFEAMLYYLSFESISLILKVVSNR